MATPPRPMRLNGRNLLPAIGALVGTGPLPGVPGVGSGDPGSWACANRGAAASTAVPVATAERS